MFRCELCDRVSRPGEPSKQLIVETRVIEHPRRPRTYWHPPKDGEKGKWVDDPGGTGTATVRELRVCAECYAKKTAR